MRATLPCSGGTLAAEKFGACGRPVSRSGAPWHAHSNVIAAIRIHLISLVPLLFGRANMPQIDRAIRAPSQPGRFQPQRMNGANHDNYGSDRYLSWAISRWPLVASTGTTTKVSAS